MRSFAGIFSVLVFMICSCGKNPTYQAKEEKENQKVTGKNENEDDPKWHIISVEHIYKYGVNLNTNTGKVAVNVISIGVNLSSNVHLAYEGADNPAAIKKITRGQQLVFFEGVDLNRKFSITFDADFTKSDGSSDKPTAYKFENIISDRESSTAYFKCIIYSNGKLLFENNNATQSINIFRNGTLLKTFNDQVTREMDISPATNSQDDVYTCVATIDGVATRGVFSATVAKE